MSKLEKLTAESPTTLFEFYTGHSPESAEMKRIIDWAHDLSSNRVSVHRLDIDHNAELASELGVTTVPEYVIFSNGHEVWRHEGTIDADTLMAQLMLY